MHDYPNALKEAEEAGFDLNLINENLSLTLEERIRRHDQALALVLEFDRIRREHDAKHDPIARPTD